MTLRIGKTVGDGIGRATTYSGGVLMVLLLVYQVVLVGSTNRIALETLPPEARQPDQFGFAFPVPIAVAAGLTVLGLLFGTLLYIVAARALTRNTDDLSSLPSDLFTRRIGRALLSAIGAGIIISIAVVIGMLLLVVPGLFLLVSFIFVVFAIAVEDQRALDSMRRSWSIASGNRWRLFALLLIVGIGSSIFSSFGSVLSVVDPLVGQLASIAISAVLGVVIYGILAEAYLQLREETEKSGDDAAVSDAPAT